MRKFFWRCAPQRLRDFLAVWMASSSAGNGAGSSEHRSEDECTEPINEEPEKHKSTKKNANKRIKLDFDNMPLKEKRSYYRCGERFITLDSILTWPDYVKNNCKTFLKEGLFKRQPEFCSEHDKVNRKVSLWQGDITCLEIDAIVNAANRTLRGGGGVDGCIHRAAGRELLQECITLNGCDTGRAKITSGHRLPAKKVIHTVGPIGENETKLQSCYKSCLKLVEEHNLSTVAFCCISTGVYGYPPEKAARVALQTVKEWLEKNEHKVDRIIFCVFLPEDLYIYEKLMLKYFPCTVIKDESEDEETKSAAEGKKDSRGNAQPVEELEMMNISPQIQNVSNNVSGSKEKERSVKTDGDTKGDTEEGLSTTASDMAQLTGGLTGEDAGALEDTGDQVGSPEDSANKEPIKGERERCGDVADKEVVAKDSVGESIMAVSAVDEKKKEDVTDVTMNKEGESKDRDQSASESSSMAVDEAVVAKASVVEDTMAASAVDEKKEEDEDVTGVRMNEDGESKDRDESASESSSMAVEEVVVAKGAIGEGTMAASAVDEKEEDVTRVRMNKEGETKDRDESASGSSSMAVDEMVVANGAVGEGTMAASAMDEKEEDVTRVRMNKEGESKDRDESASGSSSMVVDEVVVANGAVGEGTMAASALDEKEEDVTRVRMNKEGESKDRDESASGSSSMAVGEVVGAKGAVGEGTMAVCAMGEKKDNDVTDVRMNKECETKDRRESASGSSSMARDEVVEEKDDTQETKGMKKEEKKEDGEEQMDADNKTTEDAEEMVTDADQEAGTETDL